ncbi:uncharacterized protein O3C94_019212 [Discoglossus pictus]
MAEAQQRRAPPCEMDNRWVRQPITFIWKTIIWVGSLMVDWIFKKERSVDPGILAASDQSFSSAAPSVGNLRTTKLVVGIFSREAEDGYRWLSDFLRSQSRLVEQVRPVYISNNRSHQVREEVSRCTFAILYHSKNRGRVNITDVTDSLYDEELEYLSSCLGKGNVCVVADDLDNVGPEEKQRILGQQTSIRRQACDLFLFSHQEKKNFQRGQSGPLFTSMKEKLQQMLSHISPREVLDERNCGELESLVVRRVDPGILGDCIQLFSGPLSFIGIQLSTKCVVGIFSREAEDRYRWLSDFLRSQSRLVEQVRPVYISNNQSHQVREEVSRCTFAILYHSKKRGRVNITDVTDSLYDEELEYLSSCLGKGNVCVVADDLGNVGPEEKQRILGQQTSIRRQACDLFLFSNEEKMCFQRGQSNQMEEKLQEMTSRISSRVWPYEVIQETNGGVLVGLVRIPFVCISVVIKKLLRLPFIKCLFQGGVRPRIAQ